MDTRDISLSSYDYELSPDLIAQKPIEPRHSSRLLIVNDLEKTIGTMEHTQVWDLQYHLRKGDLLVLNDTKVLKARLCVRRFSGGKAELFLLEPLGEGQWECLARPAKRIRLGDELFLEANEQAPFSLKVIGANISTGGRIIQFPKSFSTRESIQEFLDKYGQVPLPPYIKESSSLDSERYQTCYASKPGAVAAPTAGLHLSDALLEELRKKGINISTITLHIGLGTFRPLEKENLENLKLHSEWVEVNEKVVQAYGNIVGRALGTAVDNIGTVLSALSTTLKAVFSLMIATFSINLMVG